MWYYKAQYLIFSSHQQISLWGLVKVSKLAQHVVCVLHNVKIISSCLKFIFIQFCHSKLRLWGKRAERPMNVHFQRIWRPNSLSWIHPRTVHSESVRVVNIVKHFCTYSTWFLSGNEKLDGNKIVEKNCNNSITTSGAYLLPLRNMHLHTVLETMSKFEVRGTMYKITGTISNMSENGIN